MQTFIVSVVILYILVGSAMGIVLPEGWDQITCKINTKEKVGTGFLLRYKGKVFIVTNRHMVIPDTSNFLLNINREAAVLIAGADSTRLKEIEIQEYSL